MRVGGWWEKWGWRGSEGVGEREWRVVGEEVQEGWRKGVGRRSGGWWERK